MAAHAFISYSHKDAAAYVAELVAELTSRGLSIWTDNGIEPGARWVRVIEHQISECAAFIPVISQGSKESDWVEREIIRAEILRKPMLPLLLSGGLPIQLVNVQHEDVRTGRLPGPVWMSRLERLLGVRQAVENGSGIPPGTISGHTSRVRSVAWSPDGRLLASGGEDNSVIVRDAATAEVWWRVPTHTSWICAVGWSPHGLLLAVGGGERKIVVLSEAGVYATLSGHQSNILSLAWSPNGCQIASTSADDRILLHQVRGGGVPVALAGHTGPVFSGSWSASGRLATGSADGTVRLWDPSRACEVANFSPHGATVRSVAWSADGRRVAAGSADALLRVWNVESGTTVSEVDGAGPVYAVAWSPDGRLLAHGGADGAVSVRDADTGAERTRLTGHVGPVRTLAWSPRNPHLLASGGDDGSVRVWRIPGSGR